VRSDLEEQVASAPGCALGVVIRDVGEYLLALRDVDRLEMLGDDHGPAWRDLDVAVLHRGVLEQILGLPEGTEFVYEPDTKQALSYIESGERDLVFILKGTPPSQIKACADAGEYMPQKATYLYPKLPSGAVVYRLV